MNTIAAVNEVRFMSPLQYGLIVGPFGCGYRKLLTWVGQRPND